MAIHRGQGHWAGPSPLGGAMGAMGRWVNLALMYPIDPRIDTTGDRPSTPPAKRCQSVAVSDRPGSGANGGGAVGFSYWSPPGTVPRN